MPSKRIVERGELLLDFAASYFPNSITIKDVVTELNGLQCSEKTLRDQLNHLTDEGQLIREWGEPTYSMTDRGRIRRFTYKMPDAA